MNNAIGWERALIGTVLYEPDLIDQASMVLWVKSTNEFRTLVEA
jgi:hypothetical protein